MVGRAAADDGWVARRLSRALWLAPLAGALLAAQPASAQDWTVPRALSMYRFPVPEGQRFYEERTDRGQDFATVPGGRVLAIGRGLVMTNRGYFPGRTVVLELLDGPFAGRFVFYGHARRALVRPGQVVRAGQPVSIAGGVGAPGNPGHMEVGFSLTEDGVIPATTRCDHYTSSGAEMHALLHQLDPELVGGPPLHFPIRCPAPRRKRHQGLSI
jgi:murein DD-endopeptidase MepM/ murein hydrolase activator NlpD